MSQSSEHLDFEQLNDYIDGRMDGSVASPVEEHLIVCSVCALEHSRLRNVIRSASELPRSIEPPDDLWNELRHTLDRRKEAVLPISDGRISESRRTWQTRGLLAAAAVVLVILSSGITAIVLRNNDELTSSQAIAPVSAPKVASPVISVLPANFQRAEGEYTRTIDELIRAVDAQRGRLNPETVRTVDHSLAVIDSAITEARAALVADPNNVTLVDLLSASYQRKLDLLRRASELGSRI